MRFHEFMWHSGAPQNRINFALNISAAPQNRTSKSQRLLAEHRNSASFLESPLAEHHGTGPIEAVSELQFAEPLADHHTKTRQMVQMERLLALHHASKQRSDDQVLAQHHEFAQDVAQTEWLAGLAAVLLRRTSPRSA